MESIEEGYQLDPEIKAAVEAWLQPEYDTQTKETLLKLIEEKPEELTDAFYTRLSFGTGGLRGIMGIGSNRMNLYTVSFATQGLANYALQQSGPHAVFIGYDCRHNSRAFAEQAAKVLAGNGIQVYLTKELRPTPLVSFGCRFKGCQAAIMITASHNPPEYNRYKVYWEDGGQVVPPHDSGIIGEVNKVISPSQVTSVDSIDHPLIETVSDEVDAAYLEACGRAQLYPELNREKGHDLKVVFSNLHGTAATLVPDCLTRWGFTNMQQVEEQRAPDGQFPTVVSPNPEEPEALSMGIEQMLSTESDILIACDPDADRVGMAVRHNGKAELLSGNQIACLLLDHVCKALTTQNRMPERAHFVKTIVTTELFRAICTHYGKPCTDVLTGFKYIAALIREWESQENGPEYIFGGEESYGYLLGTHARDKDGVIICALIAEAALQAKLEGKTLLDKLHDLYAQHGVYREKLLAVKFPETKSGREAMSAGMEKIRQSPPKELAGHRVQKLEDYLEPEKTGLPKSNVLTFWLADGSRVVVRPSGTEPKVKLYCGVKADSIEAADQLADQLIEEIERLLKE